MSHSVVSSPSSILEAEAFEALAVGFAKLAKARRAAATPVEASPEWISPAESPLGKRATLEIARTGAVESAKIGKRVLIRAASLAAYLEKHRRDLGCEAANDGEDLFASIEVAS